MGSLQKAETTGVGVEFYRWLVGTLTVSRRVGGYRRLNAPVRKRVKLARLGNRKAMRGLKIKRLPRLRLGLRWLSPFTLLAKIRDTYIHLLQAASEKLALTEGVASFPGITCDLTPSHFPPASGGGGNLKVKERELDKILELYMARTRSPIFLTNTTTTTY